MTAGANTATKIGQLVLDLIASVAQEFDPSFPYSAGEWIIWQGRNVLCFIATNPGESPTTHPNKWIDNVIDSLEKLADSSKDYPVLGSVMKAYVSGRIAEVNQTGGTVIPKATEEIANLGIDNNAYMTAFLVKKITDAIVAGSQSFRDTLAVNRYSEIVPVLENGLEGNFIKHSELVDGQAETIELMAVSEQGNVVRIEEFPTIETPTHFPVIQSKVIQQEGIDSFIRHCIGKMGFAELAAILKQYNDTTSPGGGPVVVNPIPDQIITEPGDQYFTFAENTFSGTGLTYTATKENGSSLTPISLNSLTRKFLWPGTAANDTFVIKVTARDSFGQTKSTNFTLAIARTVTDTPYIITIYRFFNNQTKELSYLVKSSYQQNTVSKLPVWRCKRAEESAFRSDFGPTASTEGIFSNELINQGYKEFISVNLYNPSEATTDTVFQFKPYPSAPDSTIITLNYKQINNTGDTGTVAYTYSTGSAKIYGIWVQRYADGQKLAVYVDGIGQLKSILSARNGTPVYPSGTKVMATADGPYANSELFTGTVNHGSLYNLAPNGDYNLTIQDDTGAVESYDIVLTDSLPKSVLKTPDGTGSNPPPTGGGGDPGGSTGTGDLDTAHTFTNATSPDQGHRSTDTSLLVAAWDFVNGRIENIRNTADRSSIGGGKVARHMFNDVYYARTGNNTYYPVIDNAGTLSGTAVHLSFSPEMPLLYVYIEAESGRAVDHWRDNPVTIASQVIRIL